MSYWILFGAIKFILLLLPMVFIILLGSYTGIYFGDFSLRSLFKFVLKRFLVGLILLSLVLLFPSGDRM